MDAKAGLTILVCLIAGVALAATVSQYYQTATVETTPIITYMNDVQLEPNATIDWGIVYVGSAYEFNFTVYNNSTENFTVTLFITDLPSGWSQMWLGNHTFLQPQTGISAPLTLVIPSTAETNKTYMWQHQIVTG